MIGIGATPITLSWVRPPLSLGVIHDKDQSNVAKQLHLSAHEVDSYYRQVPCTHYGAILPGFLNRGPCRLFTLSLHNQHEMYTALYTGGRSGEEH